MVGMVGLLLLEKTLRAAGYRKIVTNTLRTGGTRLPGEEQWNFPLETRRGGSTEENHNLNFGV